MTAVFESVLLVSAEAAVLALLVLGARLIVGRRPGIMLTVLYALIAARLIVPFAVSSPLSVHNLWNAQQAQIAAAFENTAPLTADDTQAPIPADIPETQAQSIAGAPETQPQTAAVPSVAQPQAVVALPSALEIASLVWVVGMAATSLTMLTGNALFMRRIRRNRSYNAPEFTALLDACRQTLGLKQNIRAICASETGTAAVYGVFRPVLLISPSSFEALTEAQKRHVLLHELSHIRRRDTLACAGATVLNIVHWFNPLVWIVFALMRRDIEVQCDAHVFRGLPGTERADYAGTLLKLAGPVQTPKFAPALFISKANIKRRVVMITKHRKKSALFTAAALLITLAVAVTGCTTAVPAPEASDEPLPMTTFTLDISGYDDADGLKDLHEAADLINGTVIKPGETISFNDIVGRQDSNETNDPQDTEASIAMDLIDENDTGTIVALGSYPTSGTVAAATALYNAAIRAELEIVEYKHGFLPFKLKLDGLNTMVGNPGSDFKISNPYDSDVTIEAKLDGSAFSISIYGPSMEYTVDFFSEKVKNEVSIPNTNEDNNTGIIYTTISVSDILPNGAKIDSVNTFEISVGLPQEITNIYKVYYDADGNKIKQELYETSDQSTSTPIPTASATE